MKEINLIQNIYPLVFFRIIGLQTEVALRHLWDQSRYRLCGSAKGYWYFLKAQSVSKVCGINIRGCNPLTSVINGIRFYMWQRFKSIYLNRGPLFA